MSVPFSYKLFSKLIYRIPYDFLRFNFFIFYSLRQANFRRKRKPNIFGFKNVMEREKSKIITFVKRSITSKLFGKITLLPLKFRKASNSTDVTFIAPLRIRFWRSKSTLDSLKRLFNVFSRKPSLVPPEIWQKETNSKVQEHQQQKSDRLTWFKSCILRYAIKNSLATNIFKNICEQNSQFCKLYLSSNCYKQYYFLDIHVCV